MNINIKGKLLIPNTLNNMKIGEENFLSRQAIIAYQKMHKKIEDKKGNIDAFVYKNGLVTKKINNEYGCCIPIKRITVEDFEIDLSQVEKPQICFLNNQQIGAYRSSGEYIETSIPYIIDDEEETKKMGFNLPKKQ